ncbi:MAG: hypothetical protein IT309_06060 [Anaerolineales bacterium]|jgi:hypothetical protein|nr:hypothetical protein [Chloroflexota bacterium]MCC6985970.1 hypothetical protein [Anaerolineales bacterium]
MKKKSAPFLKSLHILAATLLALTMPLQPNQAGAESSNRPSSQVGITVESRVSHEFGRSITFNAKIQTAGAIQQASLLFRGIREETTRVETLQVAADGSTTFAYDATLNVFPPFSEIIYWFQATLTDGSTHTSEPQTYHYTDNRFSWQEISQSIVTVHWYEGDAAFATAALESAAKGLLAMRDIVPVSLTEPVHIYIYSNVEDLSDTFLLGGRAWAGGHAHADLGVILVAISPGANQFTEMDSAIPHELAHVMLYRALGGKYYQQPAWLIEGIASMVELYPSPDYARALEIATANDTLIPFVELCESFPADSGSAYLAYAQSQSFVSYIRDAFGISGISRLIAAYSDGFDCDLGATKALGSSLGQIESRWRETALGMNRGGVAFRNLLPFLFLIFIVLVVPIWGAIDLVRQRRKNALKPR